MGAVGIGLGWLWARLTFWRLGFARMALGSIGFGPGLLWAHCKNAIVILTILFVIQVARYRYWHRMVLCMLPLRPE